MNIYEITRSSGRIEWTGAQNLFDVCKGKNSDFKDDVVKVELKESGLGLFQLVHHTLPMDIVH